MQTDTLIQEKDRLRDRLKSARQARSIENQLSASAQVCRHLAEKFRLRPGIRAAAFMAIRGEVDLSHLVELVPSIEWYLPKVVDVEAPLEFGRWAPGKLERGAYGIWEPVGELEAAEGLDVILVPGLGFTRSGRRLGMGGGFYDRTLNGYGGEVIGVAYEEEVVEELPWAAHDRCVDSLVTPLGWYRCISES